MGVALPVKKLYSPLKGIQDLAPINLYSVGGMLFKKELNFLRQRVKIRAYFGSILSMVQAWVVFRMWGCRNHLASQKYSDSWTTY